MRPPDLLVAYEAATPTELGKANGSWSANGIRVLTALVPQSAQEPTHLRVAMVATDKAVSRIHLRWQMRVPSGLRFLGDHWERGYGDLEWRVLIGERVMPWYFLTHDGKRTHGYGVATCPTAMAFWRGDSAGVSLWLDVRSGGSPVLLGERTLDLCKVIAREGHEDETPWQAARSFCTLLCHNPRMPATPIYGGNNWYYAYGDNCSAKAIERDAGIIADLSGPHANRPFQVIDDGWQLAGANTGCCSGGPWRYGNEAFPDMPVLAARLKATGVRPGIWMRPLLTHERGLESWALKRPRGTDGGEILLDPTIPEARARIREDVAGLVAWGFELIKHDFSTEDLFGRFGSKMGAAITDRGWSFYDRSRTTAEIVRDVYTAIREAFRGVQHGAFFATDADCVGITAAVPWQMNQRWLDLLSRSGTPLFVSAAPEAVGAEQRKALREAFARTDEKRSVAEPLDWLETTTPAHWRCDGEAVTYDWYGSRGDTAD